MTATIAPAHSSVSAPGSGTTVKNCRISPPPNDEVWMLKYARPVFIALKNAVSAPAGVPPLAVTYEAFQLDAFVRSYVVSGMLPLVTPLGKVEKLGWCVATP